MAEAKVELTVEGMSCSHCVATIQKALEELGGVERVEVDLQKKNVRVFYDPDAVNLQSIKDRIADQGYRVV